MLGSTRSAIRAPHRRRELLRPRVTRTMTTVPPSEVRNGSGKEKKIPAIPTDSARALVPHTLTSPIMGSGTGPLAGTTFVLKDLFDVAGRRTGNGVTHPPPPPPPC